MRGWLVPAVAALAALASAAGAAAAAPDRTTLHTDTTVQLAAGEFCPFAVEQRVVESTELTTFADGSFLARSHGVVSMENLSTRARVTLTESYTAHVGPEPDTTGHTNGMLVAVRDADGKLVLQAAGRIAYEAGVVTATPHAAWLGSPAPFCAALGG